MVKPENAAPIQPRLTSGQRGFTLTELVVVIATLAVLGCILVPALAADREEDRRAECAGHIRQLCAAINLYAGDYQGYMPPLKWRGSGNNQYPYEMFRYSPVNVTPPTYDASGGPYNLGVLWSSGLLVDGKKFYCPSDVNNDEYSDNYYSVERSWPWGANPSDPNPGYVRAGYSYYPQSRNQVTVNTAEGTKHVPEWPNNGYLPPPLENWVCVPLFKQTDINPNKSMVVDVIYATVGQISHKAAGVPSGLNAGFGDGHVNWQAVRVVTDGFDPNCWLAIGGYSDSDADFMYVMSCWRP